MVGLQLDQHVGVLRPDRVGLVKGQIVGERQTDVVADTLQLVVGHHGANRAFDLVDHQLGVLDASSGRHPDVQVHHAGVDRRKEILADDRQQRQRRENDDGDADQREACGAR